MHRNARIGLVVFAVLVLAAPLAFAQDTVAIGKKGEVELRGEARIGTTILKPGHYQFQHQSIDGQHYLVVRVQSTVRSSGGTHYAGAAGDEVARVPCRLVPTPTDRKIAQTALYTKKETDGIVRITQINIRGEKEGHVIALEPQS